MMPGTDILASILTRSHLHSSTGKLFRSYRWTLIISVFLSTVCALIRAKYIMLLKKIGKLTLPSINKQSQLSSEALVEIIQWVKRWVHLFCFRSRHGCYYRSYVLACILRQRGVPVSLNLGLRNLGSHEKNRGHCWLTLRGKPVLEFDDDSHRLYPHLLQQGQYDINYWVGSNDERFIQRHKIK